VMTTTRSGVNGSTVTVLSGGFFETLVVGGRGVRGGLKKGIGATRHGVNTLLSMIDASRAEVERCTQRRGDHRVATAN